MNNHIEKIVTISRYIKERYPDYIGYQECYTVKENDWTWDIRSLSLYEKE